MQTSAVSTALASRWHEPDRRAVLSSLLATCLALAAWTGCAAAGLADDGSQILHEFCKPEGLALWYHVLYFPAADALAWLGVRPDRALWLLSALAGAALVGASHLSAFLVTGERRAAATTAFAVAVTPAVAFHATFIEVHVLHAATVAAAVMVVLLSWRRPRAVSVAACLGATLAVLTHRSAALITPAFALVTAAALRRSGAPHPVRRATCTVATGTVVGYLLDELIHRWLGGPTLLASLSHVEGATPAAWSQMLIGEVLAPLGPLWLAAALVVTGRGRVNGDLRWVPCLAIASYGVPIATTGIATHGGYWLGAVPVLALCLALQMPRAMASGLLARLGIVTVLAVSAVGTAHSWVFAPERRAQAEVRARRIAAATAWLPEGGILLSTCLGMQYVDGTVPNVREIDLCSHIGYSLLRGQSLTEVSDSVRQLVANALGDSPVVWSSEWRSMPGIPHELTVVMEAMENRIVAEFRGEPIPSAFDPAWRLHRPEQPR